MTAAVPQSAASCASGTPRVWFHTVRTRAGLISNRPSSYSDFTAVTGTSGSLIGNNGLGKSMIAKNICHAAVLAG